MKSSVEIQREKFRAKYSDVYETILHDHKEFREEMKSIMKLADDESLDEAKKKYVHFKAHLHAHAEGEEKSLYAKLLEKSAPGEELSDQVLEGTEEHHLADLFLNELTQIAATDPKWKAKFQVLTESVEHHLKEEEGYLGKWKKQLSAEENDVIFDRFLTVKITLMQAAGFGFPEGMEPKKGSSQEALYARS